MSERKPGDDPDPAGEPGRFHMDRDEEILDAQARHQRGPAPPVPVSRRALPAQATAPTVPTAAVLGADRTERPRVTAARLVTGLAALALVIAVFYPAFHDAIDRRQLILPLGRDGRVGARGPSPAADEAMYLLVNATPRGATVLIDGVAAGRTPLVTNLACAAGQQRRVEIRADGYQPEVTDVACRPGGRVDVSPALKRGRVRR